MKYISIASILCVILYTLNNIIDVEGLKLRIIGGRPTKPREVKYLVAIAYNDQIICGGGIIDSKYILTAAHCIDNFLTNGFRDGNFKIIAGSDNLNVTTPSTITTGIKKFYVPKVYNATLWNGGYPEGDIAILELKDNLNLTDNKNLQKLELPSHDLNFVSNDSSYKRVPIQFAGFGIDNVTVYTDQDGKEKVSWKASRKMLKAKIQLLDRSVCEKIYSGNVWDTTMCGRVQNYLDNTHQGICIGDSGSPLVQSGTIVIGVASGVSSKLCNDNESPSIYTKVASFLKFIENVKLGITDNMRIETLEL